MKKIYDEETYSRSNYELSETSSSMELKSPLIEAYKSLCTILINNKYYSGFFVKLEKGNKPFYCLMLCGSSLNKNIKNDDSIYILYNNENNRSKIYLYEKGRYIRNYTYININVTVIQILLYDNIDEKYFIESSYYMEDFQEILKEKIYIVQCLRKENPYYLEGKINSIEQYRFDYSVNDNFIIYGSPIFIIINNKISLIGIHTRKDKDKGKTYGDFIVPIIESLRNNLIIHKREYSNGDYIGEFKDNKKEGYGKFIRKNKSYYIGQWLNDFEHGKGAIYSEFRGENNIMIYEGDFTYGKLNGNGKCVYENGNYYIGQFLNNLRNGKGTIYYKNNKIKYEGDFIKDVAQGHGKYIWEDGEYYIGQFYNNLRHGKGIEYYENNEIKYDGDFVNNKYEGNGKYIWKNGKYYIGQWLNGLKHGKGIAYSKDNNIIYEGNFIKDEKCI